MNYQPPLNYQPWNGLPIGMPGIYSNVPMDKYHSGRICIEASVSSSTLRTMWLKSPAHCWDESPLNPDRTEDQEESTAFLVGRASHHLLFGQDRFDALFALRPDEAPDGRQWNGNNGSCKRWLKEVKAEGRAVITPQQMDLISGMAKSLARDPLVQNGILNGAIEHSWFWKDVETGLWCKVRPDATPNACLDFADLKTTASVELDALQSSIRKFGYFQQAALVGEACKQILKMPMNTFTFVFIEKKPPYCVRSVTVKDNELVRATNINRVALKKFAMCLQKGEWLGPGLAERRPDAEYIELPEWYQTQIDERIKSELEDLERKQR